MQVDPNFDGSMVIVEVKTVDLVPNAYNPNQQSDTDFALLCKSIQEDGFTLPVIVNDGKLDASLKNMIIDGEHRWRAAHVLEMPTVPVVYKSLGQADMRASTIRHNKARGHHDPLMDAQLLNQLTKQGLSTSDMAEQLNIDPVELDVMLDQAKNYADAKAISIELQAEISLDLQTNRGLSPESADVIAGHHAVIAAKEVTATQDKTQAGAEAGQNVRFEFIYEGQQADYMRSVVAKHKSALNVLQAIRETSRK